ncbi:MAG: helix-turn-helix domain-containing protein [Clostridia bacterium]|nr:helix-turn-helix domain-containing protein [Clostridia bacterium]
MQNQDILQTFLSSSIYIYFCGRVKNNRWFLTKEGKNHWNASTPFTCDILYYVIEGEFDLRLGKTWYRVQPGQMVYIPAGTDFERRITEKNLLSKYYTHFDLAFGHNRLQDLFQIPFITEIRDHEKATALFRELKEYRENVTLSTCIAANGTLLRLLYFYLEESGAQPIHIVKRDRTMQTTLQYINENLHRPLTVAELAQQAGYSVAHFTRNFKKNFGCLPLDYIADLKISHAKKRLRDTEHSVASIAEELGFYDVGYFGKFFKSKVGVSPLTYRKNKLWKI